MGILDNLILIKMGQNETVFGQVGHIDPKFFSEVFVIYFTRLQYFLCDCTPQRK